ncbi:MAG TPA: biotin carboxylase N-terminal domain-containing protein [Candidatus Limnocylindrales bacterium]|nr:biotin carboxylase N-terminal domain-containing protein [Candidatus Limnocylindrales bacterium]
MTGRPPFRRIVVANRGEIAVRIIRACRELGVSPVAVHSDADAGALHVRLADRSERIGPASPAESYLSIEAIVEAARRAGADAIHPGYGFLSENAAFASAVEAAGMVFIGPPAPAIEALGNKLAARRSAADAGVPIVPGTTVALADDTTEVTRIGFPVMLKAAAGGGGRGMRRVDRVEDLSDAMAAARREALSAFGDGTIYVERLVTPARHVEVQLLGDRHGGLAVLGERDCSVQRRHQKLVEESPSPAVDEPARQALFESARRVAATVEFHNASTVEFLLDADRNHYFLEMNTRLQVEHGVTELVTGLDLVAWQIRVAAGERLPESILEAPRHGHAIEARIYAEDPYDGFRPTSGRVTTWRMPEGPGVRVDAGMEADTDLRPEYDPLLAKLMVHAADRATAVDRLRRALDETIVGGLQTDAGFFRWLVDDPAFASGDYDTSLVPERWRGGPSPSDEELALAARAALDARLAEPQGVPLSVRTDSGSGWGRRARQDALRR